jgi:hypothetical protein
VGEDFFMNKVLVHATFVPSVKLLMHTIPEALLSTAMGVTWGLVDFWDQGNLTLEMTTRADGGRREHFCRARN